MGEARSWEQVLGLGGVNDKTFLPLQSDVKALYSAAANLIKRLESFKSFGVSMLYPYPMPKLINTKYDGLCWGPGDLRTHG